MVSLTKDPEGNFFASDQKDKGISRITVKDSAAFTDVNVDKVPVALSGAMGMTWAHDSLYAHVAGKGLAKLKDTDGDGLPDMVQALGGATGSGEHGSHAVIPAEDGKNFIVVPETTPRCPRIS